MLSDETTIFTVYHLNSKKLSQDGKLWDSSNVQKQLINNKAK